MHRRRNNKPTEELVSEWLGRYKPSTAAQYGVEIRRLLRHSGPLSEIRSDSIKTALESATTRGARQRAYSAFCGFFDYANQQDAVKNNPARVIRLREIRSTWAPDEAAIREMLVRDGLSKKQIAAIRWSDVLRSLLRTESKRDKAIAEQALPRVSETTQRALENQLWRILRRATPASWITRIRARVFRDPR